MIVVVGYLLLEELEVHILHVMFTYVLACRATYFLLLLLLLRFYTLKSEFFTSTSTVETKKLPYSLYL